MRLPNPHPGQIAVRNEARRFNWLSAGRRWRKTTMSMSIAVEEAARGKRILWGAPTFDQVRVGWDETRHGVGDAAKFTIQRMTAEFPGGGSIVYRSLDNPDNARGHTADGVVIDEIGDVKGAAWYEVLRPMLIDTNGWLWGIGTPRGRNWFWREHLNAHDHEDSISWQVPTLGCAIEDGQLVRRPHPLENPHIPFEEIQRIWQTTPIQVFQQEILAEFVEDAGGVFRGVRAAATAEPQTEAIDGHEYVFGVDWGKVKDFTVIAVIDVTERALVAMDRFNRIDWHYQRGRLKALHDQFRPGSIYAEQNSMGDPLIEQLQNDGLPVYPFVTTNQSKADAVMALSLAFEKGDIRILDNPTLIGELEAYEAVRLPAGSIRYQHPDDEGMHDDCVMALMIGWHAVSNRHWYIW